MNAGYNFFQNGNDFEFYTAYGAAYAVSFVNTSEYFTDDDPIKDFIYRIDIEQKDVSPYNNLDFMIGITVAEIIYEFFEVDNRRIIFYICDPRDGRMLARKRKFDYWYRLFQTGNEQQLSAIITSSVINLHMVFLFNKDNVFAYDLPEIIRSLKDDLGNK